jgi:ATP-dependent exoDNAse (exonuclease V) beta subunit
VLNGRRNGAEPRLPLQYEELLQHWSERRDSATAAEILQDVIRKTDFDVVMMAQKDGPQRVANIGKLIEITRGLARQGTTALDEVVRYLRDRARDVSVREPEAQIVSQFDDVVRVLTVHQAKGLEFDIVIIPDLAARTGRGAGDRVFFSDRWGLLAGAAYSLHRKPLPHALILEEKLEDDDQQYEEEKRLLYVAVTRARQMLVLGEGFSRQTGPWLQWMEQLFESHQPGAIEQARQGKTLAVKIKGVPVKLLPASQWNIPEQLAFTANAILVGEPHVARIPNPGVTSTLDVTPSELAALVGCFRFFQWTRILDIVEPGRQPVRETSPMRLGSAAHQLLERAGRSRPSHQTLAVAGLPDLAAVFESREWQDLASNAPEKELPFMMHLKVDDSDCWVRGRMDAVVLPENDIPRVVDYKYAVWRQGDEADYDIQMTAYALALMKAVGSDGAIAELWYLKSPMKIIRRQYSAGEAEEKMSELLSRYWTALKRNEWPAAERAHCDRVECGFRQRCWGET